MAEGAEAADGATKGGGHRPTVLVACRQNAGRSQAAAALLRYYAGDRIEVLSGGSTPAAEVHPEVAAVLAEHNLAPEHKPQAFDDAMVRAADVVITMGCGESCPFYPGKQYEDWEVPDPAGQPLGRVRLIIDEIDARVRALLSDLLPGAVLPPSPGSRPLAERD